MLLLFRFGRGFGGFVSLLSFATVIIRLLYMSLELSSIDDIHSYHHRVLKFTRFGVDGGKVERRVMDLSI